MATLEEKRTAWQGTAAAVVFHNRVQAAVVAKVKAIYTEATPSAERLAWAEGAMSFGGAASAADTFIPAIIELKLVTTVDAIVDADISDAVDTIVNKIRP